MKALIVIASSVIVVAASAFADDKPDQAAQVFTPNQSPAQRTPPSGDSSSPLTTRRSPAQQTPIQQKQQAPIQQPSEPQWRTTFSTETRYYSWRKNFVPPDTSGDRKGTRLNSR